MKKRNTIYAFLLLLMAFTVSCKKDAEVNKDTFRIENESVTPTTQSVLITGTYAYSGAIDGITLELGRQSDLMDGDAYRALLEDTDFSVEVKNLRTNTTYYYRYAVDYGGKSPYLTEIKSFMTQEYNLPEVVSKEVMSVGVNRAEVSGEVLSDGGGDAVTLRGVCWSMSHNPSVGDEFANSGEGIGSFTCELTNLQPEKTYYARAFAGNSKGVSYGEELTFVTMAAGSLAEVRTVGITGNAMLQAIVNGEVTNEGTNSVIERGVCYGKEHFPTTSGLHVSAGSGVGEYICQLTNLESGATYYVRAYAINSLGIAYGEEMSFVAQTETTMPVVTTGMVSDITVSSATGHGTVVSDGGATVTRRGLCWSTEHNPTVDGTHVDCGSGVGNFTGLMPHLTDLTTYYVRAYAENAVGMSYGEEVSFTVGQHEHSEPPTVSTSEVTSVSPTTAIGSCSVTHDGGAEVTERGICWSTGPDPTIEDDHASNGIGTGTYTCMMTDLTPGTTYYVRAYAINEYGLGYGNEVVFVTSYTISVSAHPNAGGSVMGGGSSFIYNETCMVTATPAEGYVFDCWVENGIVVSSQLSYDFLVTEDHVLVAYFAPMGAVNGLFTVNSNGKQVFFSKGNLQYIGSASTPYWKFADRQWDALSVTTNQNSASQNVDRDLFGWGTSGWNCGNTCYRPYDTDSNSDLYGPLEGEGLFGDNVNSDWGVYNAISNGGNQVELWRTLTASEWIYVFRSRSTISGDRYAMACVNNVNGVILLPDDLSSNYYSLNNTNVCNVDFSVNILSVSQWSALECLGAVFLPAAGWRVGTNVGTLGNEGAYYSATGVKYESYPAYADYVFFNNLGNADIGWARDERGWGRSVRLVRDVVRDGL
jgi:hypothetical protein